MLFRRHAQPSASEHKSSGSDPAQEAEELFPIEYDMMLKGVVIMRRGKPIRQLGVTVNGCTRLVTSGDAVDRQTYEALIAIGAIPPPRPKTKPPAHSVPMPPRIAGSEEGNEA
ncbi:MAG TPA: hypothetical protein PKZ01_03145 [Candidatus Hydrogenedentes bacterium]|nr:hypothetical protein [Candidatus Hydrogenedentota bacterium]